MLGFEASGSGGTNVAGVGPGNAAQRGLIFWRSLQGKSIDQPAPGMLGQHERSQAEERRRMAHAAAEAQTADIAHLKDTVS